jgi:ATP-binding cassette, subfamily B, bacterial PglK
VSVIRKIWTLLAPRERRKTAVLVGFMLIGTVLEAFSIGLVVPAIAVLTEPANVPDYLFLRFMQQVVAGTDVALMIVVAMVVLAAVFIVKTAFLAFLAWKQSSFAFAVQENLSQRLFGIYLCQPYTFYLQRNSAQLIRNTMTEVNHFANRAITPALLLLSETLVLIGLCVLLFVVEPLGATVVTLTLGTAALIFHRVTRARIASWGRARQYHDGLRLQHLQQGFGGAKEVKLLGCEDYFLQKYREHSRRSARAGQYHATLQQFPRLWLELLAVLGLLTVVGTIAMQQRHLESIVPILGLFAAVAFRLMPSANRILVSAQAMRYGLSTVDTLYQELMLPTGSPSLTARTKPFERAIELVRLSFTYPGGSVTALTDVTMTIRKGESIGIVGPSGSGKSTLVNIILGLLSPTAGTVLVDGSDIQEDLRGWQRQLGYVPQQIYFTDDTLRRNIAFGLPDDTIDDHAIWRALQSAQLDEFVRSLPAGLDTLVGERGVRLSGGQAQRIGIARALYHDPAILVLDEATSALDTMTEQGVMEAVSSLHGTKTVLIVAHRLSTVERCDRICRLDNGRLVEQQNTSKRLEA